MGKKHKKHKSERRNEDDGDEKPHLKIVLKLGGEGVYDSDYAASSPASQHAGEYTIDNEKHHKKKKKKKRRSSDDQQPELHRLKIKTKFRKEYEESLGDEEISSEPTSSVPAPPQPPSPGNVSVSSPSTSFSPPPAIVEDKPLWKKSITVTEQMKKCLTKLLEHLLRQLERKDPHEIFAWPVNDMIAPGYSDVIDCPMDFSTMRKKISQNKYNNVNDLKGDFKLMIDNCCKYNRPDTIFYEVGKKLLGAGMKIMSKERLLNMKRTLSFLHDLTKVECAYIMGLPADIDEVEDTVNVENEDVNPNFSEDVIIEDEQEQKVRDEQPNKQADVDHLAHPDAISFTDADNEETVAPDVLQAAKEARERLAQRCPKNKMGFLRIDDVGKTTLNFLNPDIHAVIHQASPVCYIATTEKQNGEVVDLGTLTGRLATGLNSLPDAKEDKRNKVTPLTYLSYGPFGSFSPTYDSRIANVTQEESDMLLAAYGGETEYLFAKSMHHFVKDSSLDLVHMVDDLLDTLTHGAHKQALQNVEKKRKEEIEKANRATLEISDFSQKMKEEIDENDGAYMDTESTPIQRKLDRAGELVVKLEQTQNERLSEQPLSGQANLKGPSDKETAIAAELRNELTDLVQHAKPEQISSIIGVRKAMGIEISPTTAQAQEID